MKFISAHLVAALVAVAALAGCASDTTSSDASGSVAVSLIVGNTDVKAVSFDVTCDSGTNLSGQFNVNDEQDPPIWSTIMDLPPGDCSITLTASDAQGEVLCTGSEDFTVIADETVKVNVVLLCPGEGEDPLGNVEIDATFEIVEGNLCPRLNFFNAVPDEVPAEGSDVTVLASDPDGGMLSILLSATGGSYADPTAASTTYTCDGAAGTQTLSVTVSDGDAACDKSKSFDVTCPGENLCDNVVCEDDGNVCTDIACNPANGECEATNNTNECNTGGGGDIAINGGFETGAFNDGSPDASWQQFPNGGTQAITTDNPSEGTFAANLIVPVRTQGAPPVDNLIKNANLQAGNLTPGQAITVTWDMRGELIGAGGVVFVELFSEFAGGGATGEIYTGGPIFPNADWESFTWNTNLGADVAGGVTLQLKVSCGPVEGCGANVFFDNVTIVIEGGPGEPGTCSEGICVPNAECTTAADCPDTGNECVDAVCNAGTCGISNNTNVCDGGAGTCDGQGNCVPDAECTTGADCPDDGNECTDAVCNAGTCGTSNNSNVCDGGTGICEAGACEPIAEVVYSQDFNSLDAANGGALGGDGWLVFGNVFTGAGVFKFGFGPFSAPNGGPGFSAIVDDQGGPEQEPQQLSVYNDYNCCQSTNEGHFNGTDLVEAIVLQEPRPLGAPITASDIGKTFTFSFDAKNGDIQPPTTARAFIQTLIPPSFGQTNFVEVDMTNIGTDWNRYEISLDLTDPALQGQILQFGFSSNASDFNNSQNVYDNVLVTLSAP